MHGHGEALKASCALDEVQEQRVPCGLVRDVTCVFLRRSGSTGAVRSVFGFTACCLLAASMRPSSTHSRSAAAVHPVPYVYDVSRLASVCFYAALWYTPYDALVLLIGPFRFHLHVLLYHYPSRWVCLVSLFGICWIDSLIAGTVVR